MGGAGGDDTVREMQLACGASDGPTCVLTQRDVERELYRDKCESFIQALKSASRGNAPPLRSAAA
jgi:hypothetical protein